MGDVGISTEEFENIVRHSEDDFTTMESDLNSMTDFMDELKTVFNSNDMHKVANNLDGITESYQNVKSVSASYITVLKEVENGYQQQAEIIANEMNRLVTD